MSPELPELPPEPYAPESGELRAGDVCEAVALRELQDAALYESEDLPGRLLAPVSVGYALVVSVYEGYATVVPIALAQGADDGETFSALVEASSHECHWLRLPPLPRAWQQDALAFLFLAQTLVADALVDRRVACMREPAAQVAAARFAIAFAEDDG